MGTPEFAVATLGSLVMNGFNVVAVVTVPDKPAGRGQKMTCSAVKNYAVENKLPLLQPEKLKDPQFLETLKGFNADVFIVVAFRMLPEVIWKIPRLGTINLHASLLPDYRGAAPINHVIINGETITGVTTFFINDRIDTGNILLREEVSIYPFESAGELHDRLMKTGARLVIKTLQGLAENRLVARPQSDFLAPGVKPKEAPKIFPDDCIIKWDQTSDSVYNFIRGLSPYPGARTIITSGKDRYIMKVFEGKPVNETHNLAPGALSSDGKDFLKVACRNGFIDISTLQLEGKKKMTVSEFLRGFRIAGFSVATT